MKSLLSLKDLSKKDIENLINSAIDIKKNPEKYSDSLKNKTLSLWMFFGIT